MARFTAYVAGIQILLLGLERIFNFAGAARIAGPLLGWTRFLGYVLAALLIFLALRWFRNHVMWSVRNRLIVTYLFIGGVPVTLAAVMALGSLVCALAPDIAVLIAGRAVAGLGAALLLPSSLAIIRVVWPEPVAANRTSMRMFSALPL